MIEYLTGTVLARLPQSIIVNVNGVGYGVEMPLSALCDAPPQGQPITVWIETYVREDALKLYGFNTFEDRQVFSMLRSVSGIGPKIALAVLSTLDAKSLRQTVLTNRLEILESVPGIGKRTAEKLMLELRPKMEKWSFVSQPSLQGATKAAQRKAIDDLAVFDELDGAESDGLDFDRHFLDLRSALENLGYKEKDIAPVMSSIRKDVTAAKDTDFQTILKAALKSIRAGV